MADTNRRNDMNPASAPTAAPAPRSEEGYGRYERYENDLLQRMNTTPSVGGFKSEHYSISVGSLNTAPSSRKPLVAKGRPSSSSTTTDSHGHRKKRGGGRITARGVAATVLFVLGVLLLVEMMVVVAYVAAPLVGLMRTMETTIDIVNTPDYHVKLEFDAGEKLMTAGASVIGPLIRYLSPSDDEVFRTQSTADANASSAFIDWCQQVRSLSLSLPLSLCLFVCRSLPWLSLTLSPSSLKAECMGNEASQVMCEQLNQAMLTATHADGSPVLPLPKPFCTTLETLSTRKCLCDPNLAMASQDTQELVTLASASAIMCHIDGVIAPTTSGC